MKVTLISEEFFCWEHFGGFGFFVRKLGRELVKRGVTVDCFVCRLNDLQKPVGEIEVIDGVNVKVTGRVRSKLFDGSLHDSETDVFHSQCNPLDTALIFKANRQAKRVVTFQDIWTKQEIDYQVRFGVKKKRSRRSQFFYNLTQEAYGYEVRRADFVGTQTFLLTPRVMELYRLKKEPEWLPNFVDVPEQLSFEYKSSQPSIAWLARLDRVKHPELMFELARRNPDIEFFVPGKIHDSDYGKCLLQKYGDTPNVYILGNISEEEKAKMLRRCWLLVNTSYIEAMPVSFLEALAYGCPILSTQNPDSYTEKFGYWSKEHAVEQLQYGLDFLLRDDNWRVLGAQGYEYVKKYHETNKCVEDHIALYRRLLNE